MHKAKIKAIVRKALDKKNIVLVQVSLVVKLSETLGNKGASEALKRSLSWVSHRKTVSKANFKAEDVEGLTFEEVYQIARRRISEGLFISPRASSVKSKEKSNKVNIPLISNSKTTQHSIDLSSHVNELANAVKVAPLFDKLDIRVNSSFGIPKKDLKEILKIFIEECKVRGISFKIPKNQRGDNYTRRSVYTIINPKKERVKNFSFPRLVIFSNMMNFIREEIEPDTINYPPVDFAGSTNLFADPANYHDPDLENRQDCIIRKELIEFPADLYEAVEDRMWSDRTLAENPAASNLSKLKFVFEKVEVGYHIFCPSIETEALFLWIIECSQASYPAFNPDERGSIIDGDTLLRVYKKSNHLVKLEFRYWTQGTKKNATNGRPFLNRFNDRPANRSKTLSERACIIRDKVKKIADPILKAIAEPNFEPLDAIDAINLIRDTYRGRKDMPTKLVNFLKNSKGVFKLGPNHELFSAVCNLKKANIVRKIGGFKNNTTYAVDRRFSTIWRK